MYLVHHIYCVGFTFILKMLEKEFEYYLDNQDALVKEYNGKVIVIIGTTIVGIYSNKKSAYLDSMKKYKPGTFLIMLCSEGSDHYTIHQRSRIVESI